MLFLISRLNHRQPVMNRTYHLFISNIKIFGFVSEIVMLSVYPLSCQDNITNIWFPRSNTIITRLFPDYIPIVWIAALLNEHCLYLISVVTSDIIHIPINYSAQSQIFNFIISSHSLLIFAYRYNHELWGFRVMFFSLNLIALTTGWKMTSILVQKSAFDTFICD